MWPSIKTRKSQIYKMVLRDMNEILYWFLMQLMQKVVMSSPLCEKVLMITLCQETNCKSLEIKLLLFQLPIWSMQAPIESTYLKKIWLQTD